MERSITFRPITPADEGFLFRVYASTREEELSPLGWEEAQKEAFLRMQFSAQHKYYQEQFLKAEFFILLVDGETAGRLYIERRAAEIRIIDIALLHAWRNQGLGSRILKDLLVEAGQAGLPVRIHVERFNPALRLYNRLGFRTTGDNGVYYSMEWVPQEINHAGPA